MNTQRKLIVAMSLCAAISIPTIASAISVSGQGTWEATLQGRDLDGNLATVEAYYDTVLNITWLVDANYAQTSGYDTDGLMNWDTANAWAAGLTLGGYTEWRLPTTTDTGTSGCNWSTTGGTDCGYNLDTASSEMASMFFDTLGDLSYWDTSGVPDQPGHGLSNTGPFSDIQLGQYWSATEYAPSTSYAWMFNNNGGNQYNVVKTRNNDAWAVHSGDVGADCTSFGCAVPVPASAWLFGSGLLGLVGIARAKSH